jgi:anti-anti-sigma factor
MSAFSLTERDCGAGCREIRVEGELDLAVADQLREAIERCAAECEQILIGLESCEFIDSTGIAVIVRAHHELPAKGCRIALYAPSSQVQRVLSVTGLTSNGLVFETAAEALSASAGAG